MPVPDDDDDAGDQRWDGSARLEPTPDARFPDRSNRVPKVKEAEHGYR